MISMSIQKLTPALWIMMLLMVSPVFAQRSRPSKPPTSAPEKEEKKDDKKSEDKDTFLLIKNVDVYPVNGPILRDAQILVKNDKIEEIGRELDQPDDCKELDGKGMRAYPGLVSLNGQGLIPRMIGSKGDNLDPKGQMAQITLAHGITTLVVGTTALKMDANATRDAILRTGLYMGLQYSSRFASNKTRIRNDMTKALIYMRALRAGMKGEEKKAAAKKLGSASRYLPLLEGKQIAVFNVEKYQDIVDACGLAEAFGFRAVVRGATEGWTAPGAMGRANVSAILMPRRRSDPDEKLNRETGSNMANAAILHDHGVVIAIATQDSSLGADGQPGRDALAVAWDAGAAVSGGLPEDAALKAITLNAARVFALDDRIGSLEVGKDADIVICDGEMLHYKTQVYWTIVNGKISYDRDASPLFRHIRPRDPKLKKGEQWWPRPLKPMPEAWAHDPAAEDKKLAAEAAAKAAKEAAEKKAKDAADALKAKKAKKKDAPKKKTANGKKKGKDSPKAAKKKDKGSSKGK